MKGLLTRLAMALAVGSFVIAGCQAAPPPAPTAAPPPASKPAEPTKAPAAPTKAAEPAKAPAAQPTAAPAPAQKVAFPEKGKSITLIIPWAPGGGTDVATRLVAPYLEKELGIPVQSVNKAGAGSQTGITEFARSKPDGYTIANTSMPGTIALYLDKDRKATFGRKDFQPLAMYSVEPQKISVRADSPYQTIKDVVEAAKAKPKTIKIDTQGIMGNAHIGVLYIQKVSGAKFAVVHMDSGGEGMTALLGGHVDVHTGWYGDTMPNWKAGKIRVLGIMSEKEDTKWWPGVKTLEAQGYKAYSAVERGFSVPGGTPKEIVDILAGALKRAMENPEFMKKADEMGLPLTFMGPAEFTAHWDKWESEMGPLMEMAAEERQ